MHHIADPFDARQTRFIDRSGARDTWSLEAGTMVVVPSLTFPDSELRKIVGIRFYEERLLGMLLHLDNPALRIVYATSVPVDPAVVENYLSYVAAPDARSRLHLVAVVDDSTKPLTAKLLGSPSALARIRDLVAGDEDAYLLTFNTTSLEITLANELDLPLYGPTLQVVPLGSKSGARRIAARAGIAVLPGSGDLYDVDAVRDALVALRDRERRASAAVIKLNNGFSGQGNAIVELDQLRDPLPETPTVFCAQDESWTTYAPKIVSEGAIVEELVRAPGIVSPSVQVRIAPGGTFQVLSTHDQILGGPDGQVYLGCRFPARPEYRSEIQRLARRIAAELAAERVIGSFGIDLVVVPAGDGFEVFLSEINLRLGGTTHPFVTAKLLTDGHYDDRSGELVVGAGTRCYVASDNIKDERYVGMTASEAIDALRRAGVAFDRDERVGVMPHMLGTLHPFGKVGLTCIGRTPDEADDFYAAAVAAFDAAAARPASRAHP